eukprot:gene3468-2419_t
MYNVTKTRKPNRQKKLKRKTHHFSNSRRKIKYTLQSYTLKSNHVINTFINTHNTLHTTKHIKTLNFRKAHNLTQNKVTASATRIRINPSAQGQRNAITKNSKASSIPTNLQASLKVHHHKNLAIFASTMQSYHKHTTTTNPHINRNMHNPHTTTISSSINQLAHVNYRQSKLIYSEIHHQLKHYKTNKTVTPIATKSKGYTNKFNQMHAHATIYPAIIEHSNHQTQYNKQAPWGVANKLEICVNFRRGGSMNCSATSKHQEELTPATHFRQNRTQSKLVSNIITTKNTT